jgi:hypothetical protein
VTQGGGEEKAGRKTEREKVSLVSNEIKED